MTLSSIESKLMTSIRAVLAEAGALSKNRLILAAVSGGQDSMVLLHLLNRLGVPLIAAHFDHGTRSGESALDAKLVEDFCVEKGIPFRSARESLEEDARRTGENFEALARRKRYAYLTDTAHREGCEVIATGHHLNDQVETILMGSLGLASSFGGSGMEPVCRKYGFLLVRPMLHIRKEDIDACARSAGVPWREDSSNPDQRYARNRIRSILLPVIDSLGSHCKAQLAERAALQREALHYLDEEGGRVLKQCGRAGHQRNILLYLEHEKLCSYPPLLVRHALRVLARLLKVVFSRADINRIHRLLMDSKPGKEYDLVEGLILYKRGKECMIFRNLPALEDAWPTVPTPGEIIYSHFSVQTSFPEPLHVMHLIEYAASQGIFYFYEWQVEYPLYIRTWDGIGWMVPFGSSKAKPINKILRERGIPPTLRRLECIICDELQRDLLFSSGHRTDMAVLSEHHSNSILAIKITPLDTSDPDIVAYFDSSD